MKFLSGFTGTFAHIFLLVKSGKAYFRCPADSLKSNYRSSERKESELAEYGHEDFIYSMHSETKKIKQSFQFGSRTATGGEILKLQRGRCLLMSSEGM